jgi:hypothetical protein
VSTWGRFMSQDEWSRRFRECLEVENADERDRRLVELRDITLYPRNFHDDGDEDPHAWDP